MHVGCVVLPGLRREGNEVIPMAWKSIKGFSRYAVSNLGDVKNERTGSVLKQFDNGRGYLKVSLKGDDGKQRNVSVHRLVALAFVHNDGPELKTQVNHINENKHDNEAGNLEWVTPSENIRHGTGIARRAKATSLPVVMIYKGMSVVFDSASDAERRTGIPSKSIQKCCANQMKSTCGASFAYLGAKVVDE